MKANLGILSSAEMTTINGNQVHEVDDEMIVTDIKTGNKREFERMMKQSECCIDSHAPRRRVLRTRNGALSPKKTKKLSGNKRKIEVNDVVQERCNISRRLKAPVPAIVPKGIEDGYADVVPTISLKQLLETTFLDGLHVRYVKGTVIKKRKPGIADLEGIICGTNIKCFCNECKGEKVVTPVNFELHAGSRNKNASMHIRLDNGKSLKDVMNLCKKVPLDKRDQQIKIAVGLADAQEGPIPSQSAEHTSGDCEAHILNRWTDESDDACSTSEGYGQHIKKSSTKCFFCRGVYFTTESNFGPYTTIYCDQCEKEYHIKCLKEHGIDDLKSVPEEAWFCSTECRDVNSVLNHHINAGEQKLPPPMLRIIQKKQKRKCAGTRSDPSFTWRLLNGRMADADTQRDQLSDALNVFNNRFVPTKIEEANKELIPTLLKGETVAETYYGGMYCAVLIKNSKVVCTALFRVFGRELAEIPFVAAANKSKRKGFGQALIGCIENLMASMHVKEVLLPACTEVEDIWKSKFGFEVLSEEQLKGYIQYYAVMKFPGSIMLHKSLLPKPEMLGEVAN